MPANRIAAGDRAPDFELADQHGELHLLADLLLSGPVVLFFYPAAMTPGCTAESCHFRDLAGEFAALGARRVGISVDPVEHQQRFSERYRLDFLLLSDSGGAVAARYGVRRRFGPLPVRRQTFVIGADGVVLEVVRSEIRMDAHADRALAVLRARASSGPPESSRPPSPG